MSNVEFIFCHSGERRNPALNFSGVFIMNTKIECWAPIVIGATEKNKKSRLREPGAAFAKLREASIVEKRTLSRTPILHSDQSALSRFTKRTRAIGGKT